MTNLSTLLKAAASVIIAVVIICIIWYVIQAIAKWKIFSKAGESGWKAWIPFYRSYVEYSFTWKPVFFWISLVDSAIGGLIGQAGSGVLAAISAVCGLAVLVIKIIGNYRLSCAFGHGAGFTAGLILLNPIFILILGFGSSEYIGNTSED